MRRSSTEPGTTRRSSRSCEAGRQCGRSEGSSAGLLAAPTAVHSLGINWELKRETGVEPATLCLGRPMMRCARHAAAAVAAGGTLPVEGSSDLVTAATEADRRRCPRSACDGTSLSPSRYPVPWPLWPERKVKDRLRCSRSRLSACRPRGIPQRQRVPLQRQTSSVAGGHRAPSRRCNHAHGSPRQSAGGQAASACPTRAGLLSADGRGARYPRTDRPNRLQPWRTRVRDRG